MSSKCGLRLPASVANATARSRCKNSANLSQERRRIGERSRPQPLGGLHALLAPSVRKKSPLGIGIALAVFQQWSGINVIFNYAEDIYRNAGYGISGILFNIIITGNY